VAGIVGPDQFPIRDPKSAAQKNGRILNPVRYVEMGFDSASKWPKGNEMRVEKPTGQTSTHATTNKNQE
jgi:hypothetical protein